MQESTVIHSSPSFPNVKSVGDAIFIQRLLFPLSMTRWKCSLCLEWRVGGLRQFQCPVEICSAVSRKALEKALIHHADKLYPFSNSSVPKELGRAGETFFSA